MLRWKLLLAQLPLVGACLLAAGFAVLLARTLEGNARDIRQFAAWRWRAAAPESLGARWWLVELG